MKARAFEIRRRSTADPELINPQLWCPNGDWPSPNAMTWLTLLAGRGTLTEGPDK